MHYKLTISQAAAVEEGPALTPFKNVFDDVAEVRTRHLEFKKAGVLHQDIGMSIPADSELAFVSISGAKFMFKKGCQPSPINVPGVYITFPGKTKLKEKVTEKVGEVEVVKEVVKEIDGTVEEGLSENQLYFARSVQPLNKVVFAIAKIKVMPEMFQEKPDDPINFVVVYGIRPGMPEPAPPEIC